MRKVLLSCIGLTWTVVAAQQVVFEFNGEQAAGIDGTISAEYSLVDVSTARIQADLAFDQVDHDAMQALAGNCPHAITEYNWHLHVKWSAPTWSASFDQCDLSSTGNHYDPFMACGPNSEYAGSVVCDDMTERYNCNPLAFADDPLVCEMGDFSGKLGRLFVGRSQRVQASWVDDFFPLAHEVSRDWSLVLHAICDDKDYRVACARAQVVKA